MIHAISLFILTIYSIIEFPENLYFWLSSKSNTYSNLNFPFLSNSQRKNTARLMTKKKEKYIEIFIIWLFITVSDTHLLPNWTIAVNKRLTKVTWWVQVRAGWAPWRSGRSRAYASCSAAQWTWDTGGSGSKHFPLPTETIHWNTNVWVCVWMCVPAPVCLS